MDNLEPILLDSLLQEDNWIKPSIISYYYIFIVAFQLNPISVPTFQNIYLIWAQTLLVSDFLPALWVHMCWAGLGRPSDFNRSMSTLKVHCFRGEKDLDPSQMKGRVQWGRIWCLLSWIRCLLFLPIDYMNDRYVHLSNIHLLSTPLGKCKKMALERDN